MTDQQHDGIDTQQVLMRLLQSTASIQESVRNLDKRVGELSSATTSGLTALRERQGELTTAVGIHGQKILNLEERARVCDQHHQELDNTLNDIKVKVYVVIGVVSLVGGAAGSQLARLLF